MKQQYIEGGEIVNTHGVRGEVKILPWADDADFLRRFKTLYIGGRPVGVEASRVHKGCLIAKLEGVGDVNAAMALRGRTVCFDRGDALLPDGHFFLADIMGAKVVDEDGSMLGVLSDVLDLPANRVYVVKGDREILIPAVDAFIMSTDVENGVITVRLIEGM